MTIEVIQTMRNSWILSVAAASAVLSACGSGRDVDALAASSGACVRCHGGQDNDTGAPPRDLLGRSASPAVGAHTAHLGAAVACATCHPVPSAVTVPGHLDGVVDVVFGAAAQDPSGATSAAYSASARTCSSVYCHGNFPGGTPGTPSWAAPGPLACTTCHPAPPATGLHPNAFAGHAFMGNDCAYCHFDVASTLTIKPSGRALHANRVKDVRLSVNGAAPQGTWDPVARTCAFACHAVASW